MVVLEKRLEELEQKTDKRVAYVIKEYIDRMVENFENQRRSCDNDAQIDCPVCFTYRGIEYRRGADRWKCASCHFVLPRHISPPPPDSFIKFALYTLRVYVIGRI